MATVAPRRARARAAARPMPREAPVMNAYLPTRSCIGRALPCSAECRQGHCFCCPSGRCSAPAKVANHRRAKERQMALDETKVQEFVGKAMTDLGGALTAAQVVIGDKLGLYRAMAGAGPMTAAELARRT